MNAEPPQPSRDPDGTRRAPTPRQRPPDQNQAWSQQPPQRHPRQQSPQRPGDDGIRYAPRQVPERFEDPRYPGQRPAPQRPAPQRPTPQQVNRPPGGRPPAPPRRRKRRHWGRRIALLLLVLLLGLGGVVFYLDQSITRIDALPNYPGRIADTPGTNWLIVGSDSRTGMSPEEEQALNTGGDTGAGHSDTIMILHIAKSGPATLVSLPRDSYVPIPGNGRDKINAAFAIGGAPLLAQTVEEATGLRMDHYAEIGFGGFSNIVDGIGGIDLCLDAPVDDPDHNIFLPGGCNEYDGAKALDFVRERYGLDNSDIDRMNNQRQFLSALVNGATSPSTFLNPFRLWGLASNAAKSLTIDNGDHIWNLAGLAWAMRGDLITTTVPIGGFEDTESSGNVLLWDRDRASQFFDYLARDQQLPPELITVGL
ncbi:LCP family protein [Tomitella biformata]|uniref:LCP family protein n=1 Tax=Tomitella biformata TaxID=630403 RepID=UPI0004ACD2F9|nr:LCP family protein [Tomitella biformata]